jgi:hypothetical protein
MCGCVNICRIERKGRGEERERKSFDVGIQLENWLGLSSCPKGFLLSSSCSLRSFVQILIRSGAKFLTWTSPVVGAGR